MRLVFQDSAASQTRGETEKGSGGAGEGRRGEGGGERERNEETDFNASSNISLLGAVWLSN